METFKAHELVQNYIREKKISKASLQRALGLSDNGLKGQTSHNMRVEVLVELCAVLKYNFFADISEHLPKEFDRNTDKKDDYVKSLELEIKILRREKETLIDIIKKPLD